MKKYLPLCFLVMGCSTYSKKECVSMDWANQGYIAAYDGQTRSMMLDHFIKKCGAEHGVQPNPIAFDEGYKKGLENFCTSRRGQEAGESGILYQNTCPEEQESDFVKTYVPARLQYMERRFEQMKTENESLTSEKTRLESDNGRLNNEVSSLRSENSRLRSEISSLRSRCRD